MPLMIEAVPVSAESIVLIITKVEDPEELDTRFSRFAPHHVSEESPVQFDGADNIIDIFQKIYESRVKNGTKKPEASTDKDQPKADPGEINLIYLYRFQQLDDVIQASHGLNNYYTGVNSLYKDRHHKDYRLVVHQSSYSPEEFNKVCNILSEYGTGKAFSLSGEAYLQEHGELIIPSKALQTLFSL
jgi:adapter protein MecA 1/2